MRACVYGAGSLGTVLGAYISKAGVPIDLINRNEGHVRVLNEQGAKITGTVNFVQPVTALLPAQMTGQYDIIFLLTKQLYNHDVAQFLRAYLSPLGVVVCLQNGIPEPGLIEDLGINHVLGCVVEWGATMTEPGCCELTSRPDSMTFHMGINTHVSTSVRNEAIRLLSLMCPVMIEANLDGVRWSKLLINATFSGLGTVIGGTFGDVVKDKNVRPIALRCMKEIIDVGHAAGVEFVPVQGKNIVQLFYYNSPMKQKFAEILLPIAMRKHFDIEPSMLQDLRHNKRCEVRSINGMICEYGRKYGVRTPINDGIEHLIIQMEKHEVPIMHDNYRVLQNR